MLPVVCRDIAHLSWHDCELPCIWIKKTIHANLFQRLSSSCDGKKLYFNFYMNSFSESAERNRANVSRTTHTHIRARTHLANLILSHFAITVSVIVFAYCVLRVSAFCILFLQSLFLSLYLSISRSFIRFGMWFVWKHLQNESISLPLHRNIRHKSINMKAFENEEQMLKFSF